MKIRLSLGNILGLITTAAGAIVAHDQIISLVANTVGGKVAAVGVLILAVAKGIVSTNTAQIPADSKVQLLPGVILQKPGI